MSAAAAHYDVRALGEILDRAVHVTVRRFGAIALPFILADALGSLMQLLPLSGAAGFVTGVFAGMLYENRARVVVIASLSRDDGPRLAWSEAFRHPGALVFALIETLDYVIPFLMVGIVATASFVVVRLPVVVGSSSGSALTPLLVTVIGLALLLFALAIAAATVDTVLDGTPPHRSLGRWVGLTFRRRSLPTTLLAAGVFVLLVLGTPLLLSIIFPWGPFAVRASLDAIPEGIADAIALMFAWGWRDLVLDRRLGQDMVRLLDAGDRLVPSR